MSEGDRMSISGEHGLDPLSVLRMRVVRDPVGTAHRLVEAHNEIGRLRQQLEGAVDAMREIARERYVNSLGEITDQPSHAAKAAREWLTAREER